VTSFTIIYGKLRVSKIKYYIFVQMQLLRKLAFPLALLYGLGVRLRNFGYDSGLFSSESFRTPTLCIGNLSVGGTGKTPMVELLVEFFGESKRVAILSRGYKRNSRGFIKAHSGSTAEEIGDEPFQLHTKFPGVTVAVDANRRRGITLLEADVPELIVLDDAFQHRKVRPDMAILLTPYGKLYTDDYYLPAGTLRDSRREARRADIIIVTKCPDNLSATDQQQIAMHLKPKPHQLLLFAGLQYDDQLGGGGKPLHLKELKERKFTLVTGIADPGPLTGFLSESGFSYEHLKFKDHHYFNEKERRVLQGKELVLTTEKDYRRMPQRPENTYFIRVKHKLIGRGMELLRERLKDL
jgi:tetraacyldisaccharide 4'-kinase